MTSITEKGKLTRFTERERIYQQVLGLVIVKRSFVPHFRLKYHKVLEIKFFIQQRVKKMENMSQVQRKL